MLVNSIVLKPNTVVLGINPVILSGISNNILDKTETVILKTNPLTC